MSRRLIVIPILIALSAVLATPALAGSHVIAKKSSKPTQRSLYLSTQLATGHRYRIDVISKGRQPFNGAGTEYMVGVVSHRLVTGSVPLKVHGTTPFSFGVAQPTNSKLSEWILAIDVVLQRGHGLTLRVVDLGRHK